MADWNTDAQFADVIDQRFLGTNTQIENFLAAGIGGKFLVVASKGMGKTLLLRHKRKQIEQTHKDCFLIPRNGTADYVKLSASPAKGLLAQMETHAFWQDLWMIAIATSALLNFPHKLTDNERSTSIGELRRAELPADIERELGAALEGQHRLQRSPSGVLDMLLQSDIKEIARARARGQQILTDLFNAHISSSCAIFIDSFDQAINTAFPDNLEIWCNGQTGLLKAAWELSRNNRHAKIYATIRQEAYSYFRDPEKNNIKGSMLLIEYTDDDLQRIFEKAVIHYEGLPTILDFLGVPQIYNKLFKQKEGAFDYIRRHTIGVPRWLMVIGEAISNARDGRGRITDPEASKRQQKLIADTVNKKSAELGREYLVDEMVPFYRGDTPERYIDGFVAKIGSTVLSIATLRRICEKFLGGGWAGTQHPFCLLYNLGLLGQVVRTSEGSIVQRFSKPYEFNWNYDNILPKGPAFRYLVHPALHNLIQSTNGAFRLNKVRIGDGLAWPAKNEEQVRNETVRIFVSYAHDDAEVVAQIANALEDHMNNHSVLHDIWFDQWKMRAGRWFQDQMEVGLLDSDYLVLVASRASLASSAVAIEWKTKFQEKLARNVDSVLPFLLSDLPYRELPTYLANIFAHRYDGTAASVAKLGDDILYLHDERQRPGKAQPHGRRPAHRVR